MIKPLNRFSRVIGGVSDCLGKISAWCLVAIGFFISFEVLMRHLFNSPTIWVDEISRILQIWVVFLAASYALKHREMIIIDVILRKPGGMGRRLAETLAIIMLFVFMGVAAFYGFEIWLKATAAGHTTDTYLAPPKWFTHAPVWVGGVLLMLQGLAQLIQIWMPPAPDGAPGESRR